MFKIQMSIALFVCIFVTPKVYAFSLNLRKINKKYKNSKDLSIEYNGVQILLFDNANKTISFLIQTNELT